MTYMVTAAYVTLKVRQTTGPVAVVGLYRDALVPAEADSGDVDRLLAKGMLAEVDVPAPVEPEAEPVKETGAATPERPAGNASTAAWVDYAVSRRAEGVSEGDARAAAEGKTRNELVAEYGG